MLSAQYQSLFVNFDRAVPIFFCRERGSEIVHRVNVIRRESNCFAVGLDGVVSAIESEQDDSHSVEGLRELRIESERFLVGGERIGVLVLVIQSEAEVAFRDCVGGF